MPCQIDLILLHKWANDRFIVSIAVFLVIQLQELETWNWDAASTAWIERERDVKYEIVI